MHRDERVCERYPTARLIDVGVRVLDCEHKTPMFQNDGYPYIAIPNIRDGRIDLSDVARISKRDLLGWTRRTRPRAGDVILTRRGRVGDTGVIPKGCECAIGQNLVILRSDGSKVDQNFLRWALRGSQYEQQVSKWLNVGAVFDSLNVREIPLFEISIPPLLAQRAIAHILGTLDDKIELNRRMNQTLEEMARALFHSWFVAFDPVRAKAAGRRPAGMDAATAALFPDSFEVSELGEIPVGWRFVPIGEAVRAVGGSTPRTAQPEYWDGDIAFCTPKDLSTLTAPVLLSTSRHITKNGLGTISSGRLATGTVLMSSRAPIGYLAISGIDVAVNQGMIAMMCDRLLPNHYVYFWAKHNMEEIKGRANGTTFLEISKRNFRPMPALIPPSEVLARFEQIVAPVFNRIETNERETVALASLRDTLLPKLLSGEVRVGAMATIAEPVDGGSA